MNVFVTSPVLPSTRFPAGTASITSPAPGPPHRSQGRGRNRYEARVPAAFQPSDHDGSPETSNSGGIPAATCVGHLFDTRPCGSKRRDSSAPSRSRPRQPPRTSTQAFNPTSAAVTWTSSQSTSEQSSRDSQCPRGPRPRAGHVPDGPRQVRERHRQDRDADPRPERGQSL